MDIMYFYAGSGNHGCEALIKTITNICNLKNFELYSTKPEEDIKYNIKANKIYKTTFKADEEVNDNIKVAFSIGGDNYSSINTSRVLANYNNKFINAGAKTFLLCCSISEDLFEDKEVIEDLKKYYMITARESITYVNLLNNGIKSELIPDSAFVLDKAKINFDDEGKEWIGINASNFVSDEMSKHNYKELIQYIMNNTQYNVLLIPHVEQEHNNDYPMLNELYIDNGRMKWAKGNCNELKGYISKCKMVICARTHVSIASYSLCIPTLVLGYSVKSRGIATDLFGTPNKHVILKEDLKTSDELKNGFIWLEEHYADIKNHLEEVMPNYKNRCYKLRGIYESIRS